MTPSQKSTGLTFAAPDTLLTSTLDYRDMDRRPLVWDALRAWRLLISPTGSKMQTVAVGLFRACIDDVQIVYPTPGEFRSPKSYTEGLTALLLRSAGFPRLQVDW